MNRLFALPTDETLDLLKDLFQSAVYPDWDSLCVEIGTSKSTIVPQPLLQYCATPGSMGIWYDPASAISRLIIPLFPDADMAARAAKVGDAWHRSFVPYMVILDGPGNQRSAKSIINSIATTLVDTSPIFTFHNETVLVDDSTYPANIGFYEDYRTTGILNNQLLLEEDHGDE